MIGKWVVRFIFAGIAIFGVFQLIPRGNILHNPPVLQEPVWDSPETRTLVQRACFDCHSNETNWPWYSKIQPVAMMLGKDIVHGRTVLNFSEWSEKNILTVEYIEHVIRSDKMPLQKYLLLHPEARLTLAEKEQLIDGLKNSLN